MTAFEFTRTVVEVYLASPPAQTATGEAAKLAVVLNRLREHFLPHAWQGVFQVLRMSQTQGGIPEFSAWLKRQRALRLGRQLAARLLRPVEPDRWQGHAVAVRVASARPGHRSEDY